MTKPYANPSVSSLPHDQFNQSGSPNGKVAPAVLLPLDGKIYTALMQMIHFMSFKPEYAVATSR